MEGAAVLREILTRYTLTPSAGDGSERGRVRNITNVARRGARITITPRHSGAQGQSPDALRVPRADHAAPGISE